MNYKAPRGTKDVLPPESYKWQYVEEKIRSICNRFGYGEIRVPVFEHTEVFERGVGDTTDVVQKEMYTFEDKGGRSITLRPEGTAGAARAYLENNVYALPAPAKFYYLFSCYRYEKPQAGRLREFHQFGTEVYGADSPYADAEVISVALTLLKELGLDDVKLNINSVGCKECRSNYNENLRNYFESKKDSLCGTCADRLQKNPMRILDCKSPICHEIGLSAPSIYDEQCEICASHITQVLEALNSMGIEYTLDKSIVRGLDYYTTTVFEITSGDMVICGGGRYNNLIEEFGGNPTGGIGFGMGMERLISALEEKGLIPDVTPKTELFIVSIGKTAEQFAQRTALDLRRKGLSVQYDLTGRSVKAQMKYADKIGAKNVVVIGDDEVASGKVVLKDMSTGEQTEAEIANIISAIKR